MFSRTTTEKLNNVDYYVCKFSPTEYVYEGADEFTEACSGRGMSACPFCVEFESDLLIYDDSGLFYCGKLIIRVACAIQ